MNGPVRVGVIGAGVISQRGIVPHLTQDDIKDRVVLEAVCDPVSERAAEVAERHGVAGYFADHAEMLAKADIDMVSVASPIGLHFEHGRDALLAGKHVHFNKTMTTTVAEADELIALADERGLKIVASPGEVLRPHLRQTRRLIEDGVIGTLTWAACGTAPGDYHRDEPERARAGAGGVILPDWYFRKPGGGPLYDTTVYALHGLTTVLGPAKAVTAMSAIRLPERDGGGRSVRSDMDDTTMMILSFGAGLMTFVYGVTYGSLNTGFGALYFGTTGSIRGMELNGEPFDYPGRDQVEELDVKVARQAVLPHVVGPHRGIGESHVFEDIMQLVDWIRADVPTPVTAQHARHVIDIIESAYRSAETGTRQELGTTFDDPNSAA